MRFIDTLPLIGLAASAALIPITGNMAANMANTANNVLHVRLDQAGLAALAGDAAARELHCSWRLEPGQGWERLGCILK